MAAAGKGVMEGSTLSRFLANFADAQSEALDSEAHRKPASEAAENTISSASESSLACAENPEEESHDESKAESEIELQNALLVERERLEAIYAIKYRDKLKSIADEVAQNLETSLIAIEYRLADQMSRIIQPFISEQIRLRAIDTMQVALRDLLHDYEVVTISVTTPEEVADIIRASLQKAGAKAVVSTSQDDVRIQIGETVIETRLNEWLSDLRCSAQ